MMRHLLLGRNLAFCDPVLAPAVQIDEFTVADLLPDVRAIYSVRPDGDADDEVLEEGNINN